MPDAVVHSMPCDVTGMLSPDDGLDLSIPLLYQNLHNVHHLYPTIPFYRYCVVSYDSLWDTAV